MVLLVPSEPCHLQRQVVPALQDIVTPDLQVLPPTIVMSRLETLVVLYIQIYCPPTHGHDTERTSAQV